jgi:hypothetical protein
MFKTKSRSSPAGRVTATEAACTRKARAPHKHSVKSWKVGVGCSAKGEGIGGVHDIINGVHKKIILRKHEIVDY